MSCIGKEEKAKEKNDILIFSLPVNPLTKDEMIIMSDQVLTGK